MAYVNWVTYEAQLKVVYYGPGYAGKTTSLRYLSLRLETDVKELPTTDDRSVFFEYTKPLEAIDSSPRGIGTYRYAIGI